MSERRKETASEVGRSDAEAEATCTCEPELTPGGRLLLAATIRTVPEFDAIVEVFDRLRSMEVPVPAPDWPDHGTGRQVH